MKLYKELLNEAAKTANLHQLSEEEATAIKKCALEIYDRLSEICAENNLCLMLIGGSCLGAVRHQGFIPWDDDLDVTMPRHDYEKLITLLKDGKMGNDFEYACPASEKDSPILWLKIYRKGTKLIEAEGIYQNTPLGCFVDVFPIDGVPVNDKKRRIKGYFANGLRLIANMVVDSKIEVTPFMKEVYTVNAQLKRMMFVRRFLGRLFSIVNHKTWACWYDRFVKNPNLDGYAGIPTGRGLYYGESHPSSVFFPPSEGIFEGRKVMLPANPDKYLSQLYKNYMQIPPEDKRESHFVVKLELPQKYFKRDGE
jgi:lipopolysaccharide cholinephosphotransferase